MSEAAHHPERQAQERQSRLPDFKPRLHEPGLYNPPTVEDDDWWPGKAGDDE